MTTGYRPPPTVPEAASTLLFGICGSREPEAGSPEDSHA